jgi:leucyl aminopeptidase
MTSGEIQVARVRLQEVTSQAVLVIPYFDPADAPIEVGAGLTSDERFKSALDRGEISARLYNMVLLHSTDEAPSILVVGAGQRVEYDAVIAMRVAAAATGHAVARGFDALAFQDPGILDPFDFARTSVEGATRGAYDPALRKTRREPRALLTRVMLISGGEDGKLEAGAEHGVAVARSVDLARDLVNLPPNVLTPIALAERARELAVQSGLTCEVLDEHAMSDRGMRVLLAVASGSVQPPRTVLLRHGDPDSSVRLALVGKGITFDSGGLWLKTHEGMMTMKGDMGGGAAVIAAMRAIAQLKIAGRISVTGYVGATENMPGGSAMKPGDVVTALNGETIEVLNTDAEGRLVLADLLALAVRDGATHIVDIATLTGGAAVALGSATMLAAGRPMDWVRDVAAAATEGVERAWPMPLYEEYRRATDSDIADIKNTGGREASPLTATAFLSDFVGGARWTHLDIAGVSFASTATPYQARGGTGAGVGTLVSVARRLNQR